MKISERLAEWEPAWSGEIEATSGAPETEQLSDPERA